MDMKTQTLSKNERESRRGLAQALILQRAVVCVCVCQLLSNAADVCWLMNELQSHKLVNWTRTHT